MYFTPYRKCRECSKLINTTNWFTQQVSYGASHQDLSAKRSLYSEFVLHAENQWIYSKLTYAANYSTWKSLWIIIEPWQQLISDFYCNSLNVSNASHFVISIISWLSKMADNMITDQRWPLHVPSMVIRILNCFNFSDVWFLPCIPWIWFSWNKFQLKISGMDWGFPMGGTNPKGGAPSYYWTKIPKLHENKEILMAWGVSRSVTTQERISKISCEKLHLNR